MEKQINAQALFEILAREHAGMLISYVRTSVSDAAMADDIFQETMLTAWRKLGEYDNERPFGPWLRGIAAKIMLAHFRKSARSGQLCEATTLEYLSDRFQQVSRLQGDTFDEKLEALRDCIEQLPDNFRHPIQLRYQEELSYQDIAQQLEVAIEAVKKRLQRAKTRLLECIQRKLQAVEAV